MPCTLPPGHVYKREPVANVVIAHVYDIGFRKKNDRVAVGVAGWIVQCPNVFTVQVNRNIVIKGNDGQRGFLLWLLLKDHGAAIAALGTTLQALAHIILGNDGRALVAKGQISSGM